MNQQLEIHIKDGKCKVFEGPSRRVFFATEESIGLALLRLNPSSMTGAVDIHWQDFLADRGVAMALSGDRVLTMLLYPSQKRTIQYIRGETREDYTLTFPTLLMAVSFRAGRMEKSQLWCVKPGMEKKLSTGSSDPALAMFPYGNVYAHGGICWGTTPIKDIRQPSDAIEAFFNSGFNGDLYSPGMLVEGRTATGRGSLHELLRSKIELPGIVDTMYTKPVDAVAQDINRV